MEKEKKYFLAQDAVLDGDSSPFAVSPNSWVNSENIRVRSTDKGGVGAVECIGGTLMLSSPQPSINFITIGKAVDDENNRFCYFKYCTTGPWHKISCWDVVAQVEYDVLLSSQVTGYLGFDKDHPIHSAKVIGGLLYWTDNLNQPRRINIDAGIKMNHPSYITDAVAYVAPLQQWIITVIRRAAYYPPNVTKKEDVTFDNNFLVNDATQYATRYIYRDFEYSVIGPYSVLMPYNDLIQVENYVEVKIPTNEFIDQDILEVELIVRFGNNSNPFVIHTWDRTDIDAHNSGTALQFDFYNDITGSPVDQVSAAKPFDSVPRLAETIELAKNRSFFANVLEGYDTPSVSSLSASSNTVEDGATSLIGTWGILTVGVVVKTYDGFGMELDSYFVYRGIDYLFSPGSSPTYYYFGDITTYPSTIDISTAIFSANTLAELADLAGPHFVAAPTAYETEEYTGLSYTSITTETSTVTGTTVLLYGRRAFKSDGTYMIATWFFDEFRRKCGVVFKDSNKIKMPERTYAQSAFNVGINWSLDNSDALNEIPDWAYYYCVGRTKCLTTDFFLEARNTIPGILYVTKDDAGLLTYSLASAYSPDMYGVAIDISYILNFGMGYSFQEGDLVNLYFSSVITEKVELSIIQQDSKFLILQLRDFDAVNSAGANILYEIYTPKKQTLNEFFYEVGEILPVTDPSTSARMYSVTSGILNGDIYLIKRNVSPFDYFTENMSPNDKYWRNWETDIGWPNLIDKIGEKRLPTQINFSDVYLQGTKSNGLSSFGALNVYTLDASNGEIMKLVLTSKTQVDGDVMLAICFNQTISMYLGEQQLFDTQGSAFIAAASNVIGTSKALRGSYGTRNPESVVEFRGNVFWLDATNGKIIQYGANGMFPISNYKMTRFWKLFSDMYLGMTNQQIEDFGSRPFIFTEVDPYHNELLISIPKLSNTPPKGYSPDYPSQIFPFDVFDAQGKTMVFKLDIGAGTPFWMSPFSFNPENFVAFQNKLYSFKNGHLYLHNQTNNYNEFYGIQYSSKIMVVSNALPNKPKMYDNVTAECNLVPSFVYMFNNYPIQQASDLVDLDFRDFEGNYYATVFRNKLVPTATGYTTDGLMTGEKMRNVAMWVMFEWRITTALLELKFIDIGYSISRGNPI